MNRMVCLLVLGAMLLGCRPSFAPPPGTGSPDDDPGATRLSTVLVAAGLSRPVFVTAPPGDPERLFILEQHSGRVRIFHVPRQVLAEEPFLTIGGLATDNEEGLLGFAFAPDYETSGRFYVNYTKSGSPLSRTEIARGTVSGDPDRADPELEILMAFDQPFSNHNGGALQFGPDGYLYIATGDGGSAGDPGGRGQSLGTLLGKILRIDVDSGTPFAVPETNPFLADPNARDEIWASGLRNPWRFSFDRETGDMYIGDVGQDRIEEIDFEPAGSEGGMNYGWRRMESGIGSASCRERG